MSSPLPFVPFGNHPQLSREELAHLTVAIVQAMKESVANIQLAEVASAGLSLVTGVIKGKFGILADVSGLVMAVAKRDWSGVQDIIYDKLASIAGVDDLLAIAEAIKTVDNGRASVALMKNINYKIALKKLD